MTLKKLALVPARSGSKRIADKNIKLLNGHPLIAYTISAALESGVFDTVICATDNQKYAEIAMHYGAEVPCLRPHNISGDKSPDIDWVVWILNFLREHGRPYDVFSILRPTSPFRLPSTIRRAYDQFISDSTLDSLRAVSVCREHPGKMWVIRGNRLLPILPYTDEETPWHSSQYTSLPKVYVQNASLEIAWTRLPLERNTIAGESIRPFINQNIEGFDINEEDDWVLAEHHIRGNHGILPQIKTSAFSLNS
jgi:CMP-N,N'-diacetyllegionaminic acid synthase